MTAGTVTIKGSAEDKPRKLQKRSICMTSATAVLVSASHATGLQVTDAVAH
jgi:hypothetical protein